MVLECSAMILVVLMLCYILMQYYKGSGYAIGALPLVLVPLVHILGRSLAYPVGYVLRLNRTAAYIALDVTALMLTCLLLGLISANIRNQKRRWSYLLICGGFSTILTCTLLVRSVL